MPVPHMVHGMSSEEQCTEGKVHGEGVHHVWPCVEADLAGAVEVERVEDAVEHLRVSYASHT